MSRRTILLAAAAAGLAACQPANTAAPRPPERPAVGDEAVAACNLAVGTQTFKPRYHFDTNKTWLVESAERILEMGSDIIKFELAPTFVPPARTAGNRDSFVSLTDCVRRDPSFRRVLELPFRHYHIWTYAVRLDATKTRSMPGWWNDDPFGPEQEAAEYEEVKEFASHLLRTFDGSGKTFYLGHWEGDWHLVRDYNAGQDPIPARVEGMVKWLDARQRAIDDAKRETPHRGVDVFQYTEVNLVRKALAGKKALVTEVLPRVSVDYVSYSSYDSIQENVGTNLVRALDLIESKLKPRPGLPPGRRVWIGEYGFPAEHNPPERQDARSREVMRTALKWGCPFVLYWEFYCNERKKDGTPRGFWMIDDRNAKQPVYHTHERFYKTAREWVRDFAARHGRLPDRSEFGAWAATAL